MVRPRIAMTDPSLPDYEGYVPHSLRDADRVDVSDVVRAIILPFKREPGVWLGRDVERHLDLMG